MPAGNRPTFGRYILGANIRLVMSLWLLAFNFILAINAKNFINRTSHEHN